MPHKDGGISKGHTKMGVYQGGISKPTDNVPNG